MSPLCCLLCIFVFCNFSMGKRQKRIFRSQLHDQREAYLGHVVNVIMSDARTLHGLTKELSEEALLVQDLAGKMHLIPLNEVAEVVVDFEAAY